MTPGQQLAELAMVTQKEIRTAGGLQGAMTAKARALAVELHCDAKEAMAILIKGLTELMPYVHQRRPIAVDATHQVLPTMFVVAAADMAPQLGSPDAGMQDADIVEGFLAGEREVGPDKSDGEP